MKIGDVAERAGTTPRTVRYYEEIGLLAGAGDRPAGAHRAYTDADLERLTHILRLKELLGVSLDDLKAIVEAEDARAALRAEWQSGADATRKREIVEEGLALVGRQLELVRARRAELDGLEHELVERTGRLKLRLEEL
ncbi:MAG: MerR family transcriptional regulator, repressor of the yfmOP operon [Solirubrobacteraceae bacterium]|jgi:DNA-binding transcriptional MerR regulator|nr:MerR family transcriptional regulator, repressor of the yfmOP operon [Solirubrobacteraceae bacterium]